VKQKKPNVKVSMIERDNFSEQEADQIALKLGWELGKLIR